MKSRVCYLTDVLGNTYLGFKFELYTLEGITKLWEEKFRSATSDHMTQSVNREVRDGESFHSTLLSVQEFNSVDRGAATAILEQEYKFTVCGIGKAYDKGKEAQFVVLECEPLQDFRATLGLPRRDLHITLGFDPKDVFTQPKDRTSIYIPLA